MRIEFARRLGYLAAILVGNAIYFVTLVPILPESLRHQVFTIDLGLAVDFFICTLVFLVIRWWRRG